MSAAGRDGFILAKATMRELLRCRVSTSGSAVRFLTLRGPLPQGPRSQVAHCWESEDWPGAAEREVDKSIKPSPHSVRSSPFRAQTLRVSMTSRPCSAIARPIDAVVIGRDHDCIVGPDGLGIQVNASSTGQFRMPARSGYLSDERIVIVGFSPLAPPRARSA